MGGWRGVIWYGGRAGVAVLYSVVVGAVREFWVKTAAVDVKVHEIPNEIENTLPPLGPSGSPNGVPGVSCSSDRVDLEIRIVTNLGGYITDGVNSVAAGGWVDGWPNDSVPPYPPGRSATGYYEINPAAPHPDWVGSSFDTLPATDSLFGIPSVQNWWPSDLVRFADLSTMRFREVDGPFGTLTFGNVGIRHYRANVRRDEMTAFMAAAPAQGALPSIGLREFIIRSVTSNGSCDGSNPGGPSSGGPASLPNPYEAFTSALNPKVFALIKSNLDDAGDEFGELAYKQLVGETVSDLGSTASGDDWRGAAVSLAPTAEITDPDSCIETFLDTVDGALIDGDLYAIALDQIISGQSLLDRLQTSPDTVTATLTTQSATSGVSCTLGTAAESTVQVPSPGRGTIEGITYIP